jgi:hypothetical protein
MVLGDDTRSYGHWSRYWRTFVTKPSSTRVSIRHPTLTLGQQDCVNPSVDVVFRLNYSTTRSPWSVLFKRRPPSAVTVTMSSIRTPNLPAR